MHEHFLEYFFKKSPVAFSYNKALLDSNKNPFDCKFMDASNAFEAATGIKASKVAGKNFSEVFSDNESTQKWKAAFQSAVINNKTVVVDIYNKDLDKWIRNTFFMLFKNYFACIFTDVTKEYSTAEQTDSNDIIDEITGLYSESFFEKRISEEIERSDRYNEALSLILFNVNNYSNIIEGSGKAAANSLLSLTAETVNALIRKYDILVRLEEGKFALLMPKTPLKGAIVVSEKLKNAFESTDNINIKQINISFSVSEKMMFESYKNWSNRMNIALTEAIQEGNGSVVFSTNNDKPDFSAMKVQWRFEWESGDDELDKQHKNLVEILNNIVSFSNSENEYEQTLFHLDLFVQHLIEHFQYEEQLLLNIAFYDADRHFKIHKNLIGKLFQLKEAYQSREINTIAFLSFLIDEVVVGHLLSDDMQFFPYTKP